MYDISNTSNISNQKNILRKTLIKKLKTFDGELEDSYIINEIENRIKREDCSHILAFYPLPSEPKITPILSNNNIALPYIENRKMYFSLSKHLAKNKFGVLEPEHIPFDFSSALMLVPLIAFDQNNYRLGRGGGYYDRFINENREKLYTIGVAYSISYVKTLPIEPFDEKLDEVITILNQTKKRTVS